MNGYERRKQKKMEQIYKAAMDRFVESGYTNANIADIAAQAGVSPATIYNYFGTKEKLFVETVNQWVLRQLAEYESIMDSDLPFPDKVAALIQAESDNLDRLLNTGIGSDGVEAFLLWDEFYKTLEEQIRHFYVRFIDYGKREGWIARDLPEDLLLAYFQMHIKEMKQVFTVEGTSLDSRNERINLWLHLFFYGVRERDLDA